MMTPQVFGEYALLLRLGDGAAGEIFLARPFDPDRGLPTPLVIKRLRDKHAQDEQFMKRFRHEAAIAVRIHSPHVARVYAVGSADRTLYIAMEHIAGVSASRLLYTMLSRECPAPIALACELIAGALDGLEALHAATDDAGRPLNVVHRDLSPRNLMVGDDARIRLIDLGLGKSNIQDWRTAQGAIVGSLGYMAPEQITGPSVDHRADLYSMGVILYEMLTLKRFIQKDSNAMMLARGLSQDFTPPSHHRRDIYPELDALLARALGYDPSERFQTAQEFAVALRGSITHPVTNDQAIGFLHGAMSPEVEERRALVARLLAQPLPLRPNRLPLETTFAVHDTIISVRTTIDTERASPVSERGERAFWWTAVLAIAALLTGLLAGGIVLEVLARMTP